ncbi:hypothetical protein HN51_040965 [Arachis hypogaea]
MTKMLRILCDQLHVIVIVFNNRGVYEGDRRTLKEMNRPHKDDPIPTFFVPKAGYYVIVDPYEGDRRTLKEMNRPHKDDPIPTFFVPKAGYYVIVDPYASSESGGCNTRTDFQIICNILKLRFL